MTHTRLVDDLMQRYSALLSHPGRMQFTPPVLLLALELGAQMNSGALAGGDIAQAISVLSLDGLEKRAQRMAGYLGPCDPNTNRAALKTLLTGQARDVPFETYKERVERVYYGFVFTAHPTFTLTKSLTETLAYEAAARGGSSCCSPDINGLAEEAAKPFHTPDLSEENDFALQAIAHLQNSLAVLRDVALEVGREHYPDQWTALRPRLGTVASWVGFDLDGRRDIGWQTTFAKRITVQVRQLSQYRETLNNIAARNQDTEKTIAPLLARLDDTIRDMDSFSSFFDSYNVADDDGLVQLQEYSRHMVAGASERITSAAQLAGPLESLLSATDDGGLRHDITAFLSSLSANGTSLAQMHIRVNAAQIHNALRRYIELTSHPNHPHKRQDYLDDLKDLLANTVPCQVNFGDLLKEQASARRQFMLMQQIVKHVDADSPIRFLIAETESAYTILSALYLATRFGVARHVDICPLFETSDALEHGSRFFETLLEIPAFRDYVRSRGRLCIQTGYSDAGRYIGQGPATGSIERLKERMVRLLKQHGMHDVSLLFFDTHGESVGRGCHPGSMRQRMEYVCPPHFRAMLAENSLTYIQESSFQGGDGYSWFMHPDTALAAVTRVMNYWLTPTPTDAAQDPYYADKGAVNSFFNTVAGMQAALMADPNYGALLTAFGPNLMHGTGSRAVKRQGAAERGDRPQEARQLRAIPHNGILGQMGLLANTVTGLGSAIKTNMEFYETMMQRSLRFRTIMDLVHYGAALSDPLIMKAYIDTLDPQTWLMRENGINDARFADKCDKVARQLRHMDLHTKMKEVFGTLFSDYILLHKELPDARRPVSAELACLHAIRLTLIQQVFLLASDIPRFSPGHEITREEILEQIYRLDIESAVTHLSAIFPLETEETGAHDFGEPSDYTGEKEYGYAEEHARILQPLLRMGTHIRDISTAIAQHHGFIG